MSRVLLAHDGAIRRAARAVVPLRVRRPLGIVAHRARRALGRVPEYAQALLGRLPFLAARERVYDDDFYEQNDATVASLYAVLVDALVEFRSPRTVVDVGCGDGLMLRRFAERGVSVRGVEGSRAAIRRSGLGDRVVRSNLEGGVPDLGRFDLCLCVEVAEHLRPAAGPRLVAGLVRLSDVVVFTAAPPGQPGRSHINLRPQAYWTGLFREHGLVRGALERDLANAISHVPEPAYVHANLMVFEKLGVAAR